MTDHQETINPGHLSTDRPCKQVVICGITTNHCCETTARVAGNLGYDTTFVIDATHAFHPPGLDGSMIPATHLSAITAANLDDEFATVTTTLALTPTLTAASRRPTVGMDKGSNTVGLPPRTSCLRT